MSYRFADNLRAGSGRNSSSVLILLASCQQTRMTYTIAVCTVLNSWWWTKELSETCRVLFQNKFEKLVTLVSFIIRIYHDAQSSERRNKKYILNYIFLLILCVTRLVLIFTPIRRNSCRKIFTFGCRNCTKQRNCSHCESACIRPDSSNVPYLHKMYMSSL